MKDIEDRLKEEYDKVEVPDHMFDTSRVFERVKKKKSNAKRIVIASAASIAIILIIAITILVTISNYNIEDYKPNEKAEVEEVKGEIVFSKKQPSYDYTSGLVVSTIKTIKIVDYRIIDNIPYSVVKANILNCYFGNVRGEIEIYVPGGIFTAKDIRDKINNTEELNDYNDDDLIQVIFFNEVYIPVTVEEKTYICTLEQKDNGYFVNINSKYGFKEFNPETNIVKDDLGDEPLQIEKYLENITK